MEVSAKRPVPLLRQVVAAKKPVSGATRRCQMLRSAAPNILKLCCSFFFPLIQTFRDPRFDDLSGEYKPEIFEKTYKFIDDIKHKEKQVKVKFLGLDSVAPLMSGTRD